LISVLLSDVSSSTNIALKQFYPIQQLLIFSIIVKYKFMLQIHVRKVLVCIQWKSVLHISGTPWDSDFHWMTSLKTDIYMGFYLCLLIDFVHTWSSSWLYNTRL